MNIFKKILYFSTVFLFSKFSYADDGIDAAIDKWLTPISDFVVGFHLTLTFVVTTPLTS